MAGSSRDETDLGRGSSEKNDLFFLPLGLLFFGIIQILPKK